MVGEEGRRAHLGLVGGVDLEDDLRGRELNQKLKRLRLFGIAVFGQVDEVFLKAVKAVQAKVEKATLGDLGALAEIKAKLQEGEDGK